MTSSVREYAVLYINGKAKSSSASTAHGGNALLTTDTHHLDGPEHSEASDLTRLDATVSAHGLLPKLSGDPVDRLDGEGVFRPVPADEVTYDNASSGLAATDAQGAIDELATSGIASGSGNVYTVTTQTPQSRLYLVRDGTWRDPLISGDGVIAQDVAPAVQYNTSDYNAWPSTAKRRLNDGRLLRVWTKTAGHHTSNTAVIVGQCGTENLDGTVTWDSPFTIYDDPSLFVSARGVTILSTGRVIVSFFRDDVGAGLPLDGAYAITCDGDPDTAAWNPIVTVNSTLTSYSYMSGNVLELVNGDCIVLVEGKNSGDTFSRMVMLRSTDHGDTWGSQVTLATGTRDYYEGMLGLLDDGSIMALLRTSDTSGDIYLSRSLDGGATWSTPSLAFAGHGSPNWWQLSTGTLLALTRENDGSLQGDVWAYTSADRGVTWSTAFTIDGSMYESEYADFVELLTAGRVLISYGYQVTSSITNSDIYQAIWQEGLTAFTGDVDASDVTFTPVGTIAATDVQAAIAEVATDAAAALAVHAASSGASGGDHAHVVSERHTSDGSATTFTLDQEYVPNTVAAYNATSGLRLGVTETAPYSVTISAAGTAADLLDFDYAAVVS